MVFFGKNVRKYKAIKLILQTKTKIKSFFYRRNMLEGK